MKHILFAAALLAMTTPATAQFSGNTKMQGAPNLAGTQVAVGTTSTLVAAARPTRPRLTLTLGSANNCAVDGKPGVTLATGAKPMQPVAGASVTIETSGPVYAACDAATTISVLEPY